MDVDHALRRTHEHPARREVRAVGDPLDRQRAADSEDLDEGAAVAAEVLDHEHGRGEVHGERAQHRGQRLQPPADVASATTSNRDGAVGDVGMCASLVGGRFSGRAFGRLFSRGRDRPGIQVQGIRRQG